MPSLNDISYRNNLQMQEWVKQKIESCDSQIKIWTSRLNDRGYVSSKQYINYQIGKYTLDKEYFNYFKYLLEKESLKLKGFNFNKSEQIKF